MVTDWIRTLFNHQPNHAELDRLTSRRCRFEQVWAELRPHAPPLCPEAREIDLLVQTWRAQPANLYEGECDLRQAEALLAVIESSLALPPSRAA